MNCYIIDDEKTCIDLLALLIDKTPGLHLSGYATDPLQGLEQVKQLKPDLIFSDVNMPEIDGLSLAELLKGVTNAKIIFTTGYKKYAYRAFELDAAGYLVKPVVHSKMLTVVNKIEAQLKMERSNKEPRGNRVADLPEFYFFRSGKKSVAIQPASIDYIHSQNNYTEFVCGNEVITVRCSLGEVMLQLPSDAFARVSRFYIIPIKKIKEVTTNTVALDCGHSIPLGGDHFRKQFFEQIGFVK